MPREQFKEPSVYYTVNLSGPARELLTQLFSESSNLQLPVAVATTVIEIRNALGNAQDIRNEREQAA
jgi:hypothetical protein